MDHFFPLLSCFVFVRSKGGRRQVFGKGSGQTALHWAAESGHADVVEELQRAAPLMAGSVDEAGNSPSELARRNTHVALARRLRDMEREQWVCVEVARDWTGAVGLPGNA